MFDEKLESFVEGCQELINVAYADYPFGIPQLRVKKGKKNAKIIVTEQGRDKSVYCFVDMNTGDVLKAASWSAPAKGARGNIYDENNGLTRMSAYGAGYNR